MYWPCLKGICAKRTVFAVCWSIYCKHDPVASKSSAELFDPLNIKSEGRCDMQEKRKPHFVCCLNTCCGEPERSQCRDATFQSCFPADKVSGKVRVIINHLNVKTPQFPALFSPQL